MQKLCNLKDIPEDASKGFALESGQSLFVVHKDSQYFAYLNWCPHLGIALEYTPDEFLDMEKYFILCSNHGALFEIDTGYCVSGPCQGRRLVPVPCEAREDGLYIGAVPEQPL